MKIILIGKGAVANTILALNPFKIDVTLDWDPLKGSDAICDVNDLEKLSKYIAKGDLLIDLTSSTNSMQTSTWCYNRGISYINANLDENIEHLTSDVRDLYMAAKKMTENKKGPTVIYSMGMNPGMVSIFYKIGKKDLIKNGLSFDAIKSIEVSEIDTQVWKDHVEQGHLISTWCVDNTVSDALATPSVFNPEFYAELMNRNVEEFKTLTAHAFPYSSVTPWTNKFPTFMSGGHEEVFELGLDSGKPSCFSYAPPVQFTYGLYGVDEKLASEGLGYKKDVATSNILFGSDIVGILFNNGAESWWTGANLSIEEARTLVENKDAVNATTVLTAAGVISGVKFILENPNLGFNMPIDLPEDKIMDFARPYLGQFVSKKVNNS